jgi:hypothetical protein
MLLLKRARRKSKNRKSGNPTRKNAMARPVQPVVRVQQAVALAQVAHPELPARPMPLEADRLVLVPVRQAVPTSVVLLPAPVAPRPPNNIFLLSIGWLRFTINNKFAI